MRKIPVWQYFDDEVAQHLGFHILGRSGYDVKRAARFLRGIGYDAFVVNEFTLRFVLPGGEVIYRLCLQTHSVPIRWTRSVWSGLSSPMAEILGNAIVLAVEGNMRRAARLLRTLGAPDVRTADVLVDDTIRAKGHKEIETYLPNGTYILFRERGSWIPSESVDPHY